MSSPATAASSSPELGSVAVPRGVGDSTSVSRHLGLLGTVIEVRVTADPPGTGDRADAVVVAEIERLQAVFNARDDTSLLRRWAAGEHGIVDELAQVLSLAEQWRRRSGGAFDPAVGALHAIWDRAEREDRPPDPAELLGARPPADPADPERRRHVDLSAIAKGWIVDRAVAAGAAVDGVRSITVNAGGDLRHVGSGVVRVGIENPLRPYDNEPPVSVVELGDAALATSGGARRGWRIQGRWYPHVLDPRTGQVVDSVASASVLAPDAATADVVATVVGVLGPLEGVEFVAALDGVACLVIDRDGAHHASGRWPGRRR
jgi:thiamine biosynthesis lipoprotein